MRINELDGYVTISREKKQAAPRDNVVFELGMFMGCLGRERCFVVNEEGADLKLPSISFH